MHGRKDVVDGSVQDALNLDGPAIPQFGRGLNSRRAAAGKFRTAGTGSFLEFHPSMNQGTFVYRYDRDSGGEETAEQGEGGLSVLEAVRE